MFSKIIAFLKSSFSEEISNYITEAYERAVGTGLYVGMFVLAVVYIILELKKEEHSKVKLVFGFYSIIVLALNLNPLFANFSIELLGSEVYWRVYWLLPIGIVLAFVFTEMICKMPTKVKKVLAFCLVAAVIVISGDFVYNSENFVRVSNYYKVPDTVLEIIFEVSADEEEEKTLAGPFWFEVFTRQVDGTINLAEGRSMDGSYEETSIVTYINNGDYENVYKKAIELNCNYIVISNSVKTEADSLTNYGFTELYENEDYTLYKLKEKINK